MKLLTGFGLCLLSGMALATTLPALVEVRADGRAPQPWRTLNAVDVERFELGHAVFNTSWLPARGNASRRDGLGPVFNSVSCDSCHNSRRRGRGPSGNGPVPTDFVVQAGRLLADGGLQRGHPRFGHVINTDAIDGHRSEATIGIRYQARARTRADGSLQWLHHPEYLIGMPDGGPPPADLVVMPRMAPQVLGSGLLERVPEAAILAYARSVVVGGVPAWVDDAEGRRLGRFGWQGTEPDIASQTAAAFAREMGLTTPLIATDDCTTRDDACREAADGGHPEVTADLFEAVVAFQQWERMRQTPEGARLQAASVHGAELFERSGCVDCHRGELPLADGRRITPYTDLLLHDLGEELADRDVAGRSVPSLWRTAPLWGLSTAREGGRELRLMHDGRARSIDEAVGWHGGAAAAARERYDRLDQTERQLLLEWLSSL
ncbi:hypothetical protein EBB59_00805 [Lysobacter pythonis]|uniref:Cytochrome c domain-containing protein n=1 Tax=Solilutibacter pythonis TaxID=2483112 RepID=A0A3M2HYR7_9GAMM|nr:di-heme oxidoredictase family protein [Lysobacter pythonis]RMH94866.1 hypothetical protein EBB59_00805 [Lysobacter pythonis]